MSFQPITIEDSARIRKGKNEILLRWAHAGHPVSNLRMHAALRSAGVPHALRPRTVEEFRREWEPVRVVFSKAARAIKKSRNYLWLLTKGAA